jgi:hypothetical protein
MVVTIPCIFTPSNINVSGFALFGINGTYTPNGTVNGAPSWLFSAFGGAIQWSSTNNRWEVRTTTFGLVATNTTGSITNLPCSTGWVDIPAMLTPIPVILTPLREMALSFKNLTKLHFFS